MRAESVGGQAVREREQREISLAALAELPLCLSRLPRSPFKTGNESGISSKVPTTLYNHVGGRGSLVQLRFVLASPPPPSLANHLVPSLLQVPARLQLGPSSPQALPPHLVPPCGVRPSPGLLLPHIAPLLTLAHHSDLGHIQILHYEAFAVLAFNIKLDNGTVGSSPAETPIGLEAWNSTRRKPKRSFFSLGRKAPAPWGGSGSGSGRSSEVNAAEWRGTGPGRVRAGSGGETEELARRRAGTRDALGSGLLR